MALFEHETKLISEIPESAEVVLTQAGAWRTGSLMDCGKQARVKSLD
jgi:hypothetical protein